MVVTSFFPYPVSSLLLPLFDGGLFSKSLLFLGLLTLLFVISIDAHKCSGFCASMMSSGCMDCFSGVIPVVEYMTTFLSFDQFIQATFPFARSRKCKIQFSAVKKNFKKLRLIL